MAAYDSPHLSPCRGHYVPCKVYMLDDTVLTFDILPKSLGRVLFDAVVGKLQLLESDYFDLEYLDSESVPCWLDHEKPINKQINAPEYIFRFLVKFYTPDPELLEEELTRYLFALQVKRDLLTGALFCQEHTAVLLASFVVQAEVGNFCDELADQGYLSNLKLLPSQTMELEYKIMEHHKEHIGQSPAEADFNLLDTARKVEVYGIRMHQTKDHDGITLQLSVTHAGIVVFQNFTKINSFSWAKIRKLCFKRKKFIIKLHADGSLYSKDSVEFYFPSRNWSKNFWKRCIEYHAFFRCHTAHRDMKRRRSRSRVVSRGSSFRYSGRTQKELVEFVRDNYVSPTPFERSTSMRTMSALNSRASTPRSGTLNSHRDVHYGSGVIAGSYTMASGSRTLDRSCPGSFDRPGGQGSIDRYNFSRYGRSSSCDRAPFDRSCPGSFEHRHVEDNVPCNQPSRSSFRTFQPDQVNGADMVDQKIGNNSLRRFDMSADVNHRSEVQRAIDPSYFMLQREEDLRRVPLPSSATASLPRSSQEERCVPRSPEVTVQKIDHVLPSHCRPPAVPNHQSHGPFYRQDRFELTPGNSHDQSSPPVYQPPVTSKYDSFRRGRLTTELRGDTTGTTATSKSTTSGASLTLTSSASIMSSQTDDSEDDSKRKLQRFVADSAYCIIKELLMTERTYKKDLEIIAVRFQDSMSRVDVIPDYLSEILFGSIVPVYEFHCGLLKEIDQRVALWESSTMTVMNGSDGRRIGDLLLANMTVLQRYRNHLDRHEEILAQFDIAIRRQREIQRAVEDFESQKICYLPLTAFFLKPYQRLLHYQLLLERMLACYGEDHVDIRDCKACLALITAITEPYAEKLKHIQNWQKLIELQRDISGIDNIVQANRMFIREGCLQKLSRKGLQQRMFFLFSDILVYASRMAAPKLQFKVHGQLSLSTMVVSETDTQLMSTSIPFCFSIYAGNRCLIIAAESQNDKDMWMKELEKAVCAAKARGDGDSTRILYPSLKSNSSSEAIEESGHDVSTYQSTSPDHLSQLQYRANTATHVCWHRCTSVGVADHYTSLQNQLSGYLLRKFKNSNGWQKLWVVFANFCLFFFKTFQDDFPLASLPLLGYTVSPVTETDGIRKDHVFKLHFRNHVYFFRAESDFAFQRWVEVISSAAHLENEGDISASNSMLPLPSPPPSLVHQC